MIWDHEHRRKLVATGVDEGNFCSAVAFLPDGDRFLSRDGKEGRGEEAPCWLWSPNKRGTYARQEVSKGLTRHRRRARRRTDRIRRRRSLRRQSRN